MCQNHSLLETSKRSGLMSQNEMFASRISDGFLEHCDSQKLNLPKDDFEGTALQRPDRRPYASISYFRLR
jgi:hypothetical protein